MYPQLAPRLQDLQAEGINKEIVFGNGVGIFFSYPDLEVRECAIDIYNEYIAGVASRLPDASMAWASSISGIRQYKGIHREG